MTIYSPDIPFFSIRNQSVVPCPVLTVASCIQVSQEGDQVVWYAHLLKNFPQFIVIHTVKGFGIVNKAEIELIYYFSVKTVFLVSCLKALWPALHPEDFL